MGREVRRVPANWQHPKNERGHFIPLLASSHAEALAEWRDKDLPEWLDGERLWATGFVKSHANGLLPISQVVSEARERRPWTNPPDNPPYEWWAGERPTEPVPDSYMPDWSESERTHWMMYEDTSEGTPISPAFATPEELAFWLAENGASAFAGMTATYEQWLATIRRGSACCAVVLGGVMVSGVEAMAEPIDRD